MEKLDEEIIKSMKKRNLYYKALASFVIFILIVIKDISVSYFRVIPIRGPLNTMISWFLILPFSIVGFALSFIVVRHYYNYSVSSRRLFMDGVLLLSLPNLLYILYFFVQFFFTF